MLSREFLDTAILLDELAFRIGKNKIVWVIPINQMKGKVLRSINSAIDKYDLQSCHHVLFNLGDRLHKPPFVFMRLQYTILTHGGNSTLKHVKGMPVRWGDPLLDYTLDNFSCNYDIIPSIGFMGFAGASTFNKYKWFTQYLFRQYLGSFLTRTWKENTIPGFLIRERVINILKESPMVNCDFKILLNYKAGLKTKGTLEEYYLRKNYYQQLMKSPYTLCIRGGGNFSVRFYETLACGRIPIIIDTDCLWPGENKMFDQIACVYFNYMSDNLEELSARILAYHSRFTPDQFKLLQERNRLYWLNNFSDQHIDSFILETIDSLQ